MQRNLMVLFTLLTVLSLILIPAGGARAQGPDPWQKKDPRTGTPTEPVLPTNPEDGAIVNAAGQNLISDPSFEFSYPSGPYWDLSSSTFGTPLCTTNTCGTGSGTAGPRTGSVWAWMGGVPWSESASASQLVPFPACGATLQFYFWIGIALNGSDANDRFFVKIDNTQVFTANATQRSLYPSYKLVTINANAFADGRTHRVAFHSTTTNQLVTFNLDDISLTSGPCVTISGNATLYPTTLSYTNLIPQTVTTQPGGNYTIQVPLHWSGKVTPSYPGKSFTPASRTYSNLTTNQVGQNYAVRYPISGNVGVAGATLIYTDVNVKSVTSGANGSYSLSVPHNWTGTVTPTHPCYSFTPSFQSHSNVTGPLSAQNFTPSLNAGAGCSDITVSVAGSDKGRFGLTSGGSTRANFTGLNNGPVKIESTNLVPFLAAERVIYTVSGVSTSFTEMMGFPKGQLDQVYWLPWYNNVALDTQLRLANVSGSTATVDVTIHGIPVADSPFTLLPGESIRQNFTGINDGPVKISSNVDIVAAERVIYKVNGVNTSSSEMMAFPNSQVDKIYWLPWYNSQTLDTELRIANTTNVAGDVTISIDGVPVDGSPFPLAGGETLRKSFPDVNAGPVKIESTVDIVAAERVIYKVNGVNTSFTEMMALPENQLDTIYWFPWYNNVNLDTQLRLANVTGTDATVHVYIGGTEMGTGINLPAGESTRLNFTGENDGPVRIVSDQNIVAAERLLYSIDNIPTSFSEMMGLPNGQLDTIYWLPWYNNLGMDTQLRFGMP